MTDTVTGYKWVVPESNPQNRLIMELQKRKAGLIAYCQIKLESGDWHGVADAAMDIRELEAKLEVIREGK